MRILSSILLVAAALVLFACTGSEPVSSPIPTPESTAVPTADIPATVAAGIAATKEADAAIESLATAPLIAAGWEPPEEASEERLISKLFQCVSANPLTAELFQRSLRETTTRLEVEPEKLEASFEDWDSFHALMILVFREEPSFAEELKEYDFDTVACQSPAKQVVAQVNEVEFTAGDLVRRIWVLQAVNNYRGKQTDLETVPFESLQEWILAEILRQQAPGLGIQPSGDAITQELLSRFRPVSASGLEPNTESLDRESNNNYQSFLNASGISDSDYRIIVEEELTLAGLSALFAESIQDNQEQVEVQWIYIQLESETNIPDIMRQIEVEGFSAVAQEAATADGYADSSGYVGWVPRGAFPGLDPILYGDDELGRHPLMPGEISGPEFANDGIYIINMLSGPSLQEMSDKMRVKLTGELVKLWQKEQLVADFEDGTVTVNFDSRIYDWIADQVSETEPE